MHVPLPGYDLHTRIPTAGPARFSSIQERRSAMTRKIIPLLCCLACVPAAYAVDYQQLTESVDKQKATESVDQEKMGEAISTDGVDYNKAYEAVDKEKAADSVDVEKARKALSY